PLPGAVPPTPRPTSRPRGRLSLLRPSISSRTFVTRYGESLRTSPRILDGAPSYAGWGWSADGAQVTRNQPAASRASLCADPAVGSSVSSANAIKARKRRAFMPAGQSNRPANCKRLLLIASDPSGPWLHEFLTRSREKRRGRARGTAVGPLASRPFPKRRLLVADPACHLPLSPHLRTGEDDIPMRTEPMIAV